MIDFILFFLKDIRIGSNTIIGEVDYVGIYNELHLIM